MLIDPWLHKVGGKLCATQTLCRGSESCGPKNGNSLTIYCLGCVLCSRSWLKGKTLMVGKLMEKTSKIYVNLHGLFAKKEKYLPQGHEDTCSYETTNDC